MTEYKRLSSGLKLFSSLDIKLNKNKHSTEALEADLLLINTKGKSVNYKEYLFLKCGHKAQLQPTHVRRKSIECKTCLEEKHKKQFDNSDLEYISASDDADYKLYKRKSCGHILKLTPQSAQSRTRQTKITHNSVACHHCHENKLTEDASRLNMTLLGKCKNKAGTFRHYKFNACGHTRDVNATCVATGNVVCRECVVEKYKKEALRVGLTFNGKATDDPSLKRNYVLKCGHTKDIRMDHVRNGSWTCVICGDSHYTKQSGMYLVKIKTENFEWLKLGYAKDLKIRTNSYGLPKESTIETLFTMTVPSGLNALHIEKKLHALFKKHRIDSNIMKQYHKHNGYTECYSTDITSKILYELLVVSSRNILH